jgi:hypothetical protein
VVGCLKNVADSTTHSHNTPFSSSVPVHCKCYSATCTANLGCATRTFPYCAPILLIDPATGASFEYGTTSSRDTTLLTGSKPPTAKWTPQPRKALAYNVRDRNHALYQTHGSRQPAGRPTAFPKYDLRRQKPNDPLHRWRHFIQYPETLQYLPPADISTAKCLQQRPPQPRAKASIRTP